MSLVLLELILKLTIHIFKGVWTWIYEQSWNVWEVSTLKGFEFNRDLILKSLAHLKNNEMKGRGVPSDWALLYLCSGVHTAMQIILMMLGQMRQHKRKSEHFISGLWFSLKNLRQGSPFLDGASPMSFHLTYSLTGLQRRFFHNLKAFFAKCLLLSFTMNSSLHTDVYV